MPEVGPVATGLSHKLHPDSDTHVVGLDKRAAPRQQYSFGLGKKSDFNADVLDEDIDDSDDTYGSDVSKRGAEQNRFAFGLGKRAKHPNEQRFSFGLGKRATQRDNRFAFGLGKRTPIQESLHNYYENQRR